jgi:hypothetical protein
MMEKKISSGKNGEEEVNTLKSEHLNEEIRPIIACIGKLADFYDENGGVVEKIFKRPEDDDTIENVDYYGDHESLNNKNYKNPSQWSYVISPINYKDKISSSYKDCTGVAISGVEKETGKNISFLSHQDPQYFLSEKKIAIDFLPT